jgi:hypothetical protein
MELIFREAADVAPGNKEKKIETIKASESVFICLFITRPPKMSGTFEIIIMAE